MLKRSLSHRAEDDRADESGRQAAAALVTLLGEHVSNGHPPTFR